MAKLPERITPELERQFGTCFLTRDAVNSLIDYLEERDTSDFKFYTKVENGQVICDDTPPQPERSCETCVVKVCPSVTSLPCPHWQPRTDKPTPPQPERSCHNCEWQSSEFGVRCHGLKSEGINPCINLSNWQPRTDKPKEELHLQKDELHLQEEWREKIKKIKSYIIPLSKEQVKRGFKLYFYSTDYVDELIKEHDSALTAAAKRIEELEFANSSFKTDADTYKKELDRLREGIKVLIEEMCKSSLGLNFYRYSINYLEQLIKEDKCK